MPPQSCRHHSHPHAHARWLPKLDAFGSAAAIVCAVHCAFLPIAAVALPLVAVEVLGNHAYERWFVTFALIFGAAVLSSGVSRSGRYPVFSLFLAAFVLLIVGVALHDRPLAHAVVMAAGGLCLGGAHALNRHLVRTYADAQAIWKLWQGNGVVDSARPAID
ncbi:MAG: MerC domain-containing protein [Pseudomonadota bacterium]|nr:MerC domain-containing protein [Pseudomonadota bacterium]